MTTPTDEQIKTIAEAQGSWGACFGYTKESDFEKPFVPQVAYTFARDILAANEADPAADKMRSHVEQFAIDSGWERDSGEGAFEFVQRKSYRQGWEDGKQEGAGNIHRDAPAAAAPNPLSPVTLQALLTLASQYDDLQHAQQRNCTKLLIAMVRDDLATAPSVPAAAAEGWKELWSYEWQDENGGWNTAWKTHSINYNPDNGHRNLRKWAASPSVEVVGSEEPFGWLYRSAAGTCKFYFAGDVGSKAFIADATAARDYSQGHSMTALFAASPAGVQGDGVTPTDQPNKNGAV